MVFISDTSAMSIIERATEYCSTPWVELSLLCLSMLAGYIFSRRAAKRSGLSCASRPCTEPTPLKQKLVGGRIGFQREPEAAQQVSILLQQGKVKSAVALLQTLPETLAGSVPTCAARSILIAAMRSPKQELMMSDLEPLKGKIEADVLEALITGAADKKQVTECRQLDTLSRSLQIPKSTLCLEALARAYSSDASSLAALVEEAEVPLARPFAEIVLQTCAARKNFELAATVLAKVCESDAAHLRSIVRNTAGLAAKDFSSKPSSLSLNPSPSTTSAGSDASNSAPSSPRSATQESAVAPDAMPSAAFHDLLQARVDANDKRGAWRVITDMQMDGVSPNAVTCTILLNGKLESIEEVSRVLVLVDAMQEPLDDVFFAALTEACIRVGRLDVLSQQMEKFQRQGLPSNLSAHTYGSLIKAYGCAHDMKRVWDLWKQMVVQRVLLTSITIGSMIEALVVNGLTLEAWRLIQDLRKQETMVSLLDAVIYSSILKGFANAAQTGKVLAVYEEMKSHNIQPNRTTFNIVLNAFASGGTMQYVPALLEDMKLASVEPDSVTYYTLVRGFCEAGSLDRALKIFKDMGARGTPDEAVYSSLLAACTRESRPEEALALLCDMRKSKMAPSNYTLIMLVKLMGRCGRLEQAFTLVEDTSKEYKLKINIQVYNGLIQACLHNGQAGKALALFDKIIGDGEVSPDSTTHTVLVRGCVRLGLMDRAIDLVKSAHGIGMPGNVSAGLNAGCLDEVLAGLGGAEGEQGRSLLAELHMASQ